MKLRNKLLALTGIALAFAANTFAADPTATAYSFDQCRGSALPYPAPERAYDYPDSLTPVFINHVGRHGARYQSSPKHATTLMKALSMADSLGTLTPKGRRLKELTSEITAMSTGRWGALDSLGIAEQWGIAARMYANFPEVFGSGHIKAISSYVPRCVMSMYSFLHQITRLDNRVEISALSGRSFSPLLRFFELDADYREFAAGDIWRRQVADYFETQHAGDQLRKILGDNFDFSMINLRETAMAEYSIVAGTAAVSLDVDPSEFYTLDEFNRVWQCFNLQQYLLRTASTLSAVPAQIASPLLRDLISSTDSAISDFDTKGRKGVALRFGHAETLMPLFSLIHLGGGYYLTNYFDTVGLHWHDFHLVPMASNLQIILFKGPKGRNYVRFDLNEVPQELIPGKIYVEWEEARTHLSRFIPLWAE